MCKSIYGYSKYKCKLTKRGAIVYHGDKVLKQCIDSKGYKIVSMVNDNGKRHNVGIHRVIGLSYMLDTYKDGMEVDHIDNDKLNNTIVNLEWVTKSENLRRARLHYNGRSLKCMRVNIHTNIITKYRSLIDCIHDTRLDRNTVKRNLRNPNIAYSGYRYSYGHDYNFKNEYVIYTPNTFRPCHVKNIQTGEVVKFNKLSDAAAYLNISISILSNKIDKQPFIKPSYIIKNANESFRRYGKVIDEIIIANGTRGVIRTHDNTRTAIIYTSTAECAKDSNLSITKLNYRLNHVKLWPDGFIYEYYAPYISNYIG